VHSAFGEDLEIECLDDVDTAFDEQDPVGRQQSVAATGGKALESDGVGADGAR
jgi:hypothetical protein